MPSWIEEYNESTLPVQVCGVVAGSPDPTDDGRGYVEFENLTEAQRSFPDLDPHNCGKRFTWAMRGEINGKPAMRFETCKAYEMYST